MAESKGIVDNTAEKDYWVSMVLRTIFTLPYATAFVFKGGTSLSKGWSLLALAVGCIYARIHSNMQNGKR